jgi:hypothetical protein
VVPIVLDQPISDDLLDEVVADELARVDDASDLGAELGVVLDVPTEDVADADLHEVEGLAQQSRLCSLPAALDPHDDVLAHHGIVSHRVVPPAERSAKIGQPAEPMSRRVNDMVPSTTTIAQ